MRKSLNLLAVAALVAAIGACNRGATPEEEQQKLNEAAAMTDDNSVFDTSPDDMSLEANDVVEEGNATGAANANASGNAAAGNRQ